jgi:hypothetical protein
VYKQLSAADASDLDVVDEVLRECSRVLLEHRTFEVISAP